MRGRSGQTGLNACRCGSGGRRRVSETIDYTG
ncbi:hypothetical protein BPC006_I1704 [Burkholderia pseudomallei BPC006]|nr:hypothetical protein BPC006_I1704 [Burkholderia pseudomallei BPC006]